MLPRVVENGTIKLCHVLLTTLLFLLLLTQITTATQISSCGRLIQTGTPLIHDSYTTTHHWPWHAAILHQYNETSQPIYQCGGSVISSKFILTAAHCTCFDNEKLSVEIISVFLGRLNLGVHENSGQSFGIAEIIVHPDYNSIDFVHDIAIMRLSAEATFNNYVQPICLWRSNETLISEVIGRTGTVVGWGLTEKNEVSKILRQVSLPVVAWDTCLRSNPDVFGRKLSTSNFCAGLLNGSSVCQGDSGGSITFEEDGVFYIRGVVSLSPSKQDKRTQEILCDSWQYALFTDVAQYLPWIGDTTAIMTECETKVRCDYGSGSHNCSIVLQRYVPNCKVIFDEEVSNADTRILFVAGEFDEIPDLYDATTKFDNISTLYLSNVKLKVVERSKLAPFKRNLKFLNLGANELAQLDPDTFDDLESLEYLDLNTNYLKEINPDLFKKLNSLKQLILLDNNLQQVHPDLLKELTNLELFWINGNRITILPRDLFHNNKKLKRIHLENNRIMKIEFLFNDMPNLEVVNLIGNSCITEHCWIGLDCTSFNEINERIKKSCRN